MIKLLNFCNRRDNLTLDEFGARWFGNHAKLEKNLVKTTPARRIAVSISTGEVLGGKEPSFDAMAELYFANVEDARKSMASAAAEAMRKDRSSFVAESDETGFMVADEYLTAESEGWAAMAADMSKPRTKVVRAIKRKDGLTREQFRDYWLNQHSQLEKTRVVQTLTRRIVATFLTGETIGGAEAPFDGMVSLYYDSIDSAKKHFAGGSQSVMRKDEENFVDLSFEVVRVISQEYLVADKP